MWGDEPRSFGSAFSFCDNLDNHGRSWTLPVPRSEVENGIMATIRQTWIDVNVNDLLNSEWNQFENFQRRQRLAPKTASVTLKSVTIKGYFSIRKENGRSEMAVNFRVSSVS